MLFRQQVKNELQRSQINNRAGAVVVEFAVILPVIFLFFCASIEISRMLSLQHTADTAAYEGARFAMVPGATSTEAENAARLLLDVARLTSTVVKVSPSLITEETALITVRIEIPVAKNAWIFPRWFTESSVTSEVTLMCERPPVIQLTALPDMKAKVKALKAKGVSL